MNRNIVILVFQYSVVVKGIESKLKGLGYNVEVTDDMSRINSSAAQTQLFLTFLPGVISNDSGKVNTLSTIIDSIKAVGCNMIIIGEGKDYQNLLDVLPKVQEFKWVSKPIDMASFTQVVESLSEDSPVKTAKKRILIVDDDPSYAKMVREWIKDDFRVDIVTAGMQALAFLEKVKEEENVDLILLDYEMPVMDGPEVFVKLKEDNLSSNIPVVFLTGIGNQEAIDRVTALKPEGYVFKSTTREDLLTYLKGKLQ